MAPSQSTLCDLGNNKKSPAKTIPLPLVPIDCKAPACNECQEFTLKTDPANANSTEYKFHMRYLKGTEDARGILAWVDDINRVITGLGVDQPLPAYTLYTPQCMHGTALSTFEMTVHTYCNTAHNNAYAAAADDAAHAMIRTQNNAHYYSQPILRDSLNHMITELPLASQGHHGLRP